MILALIIFIVTLSLPFLFRELRQNKIVLLAYLFIVGLHQLAAVINAFWFTVIGADADANSFNRIGFELAQIGVFSFAIGSKFYENMLGVFYWLFGSSHFLGEQLSIMAFSLSCVILIKILRQLNLSQYQAQILIAFGVLPTGLLDNKS